MGEKTVLLQKEGSIATIILNRPTAMNSINKELATDLLAALEDVGKDNAIRAVVITGSGKAFCAGGDLIELVSINKPIEAREFIGMAEEMASKVMNLEKPVIAMVNGVAAGAGFNLALACDIIYCTRSARFGQSFAKVGLVPDCGGMFFLPRAVGLHKAKELMFTADLIDAETALQLGVVNRVLDDDQLKEQTYKFAQRLANAAPVALGLMKKVLNQYSSLTLQTTLEFEQNLQTLCMQTNDHKEGVRAFKERREPIFSGE